MRSQTRQLHILRDMLAYMRPHGSQADVAFRTRYLVTLPNAETDPWGNIHVTVGDSRVLWSCHTDTVHRISGIQHVLAEDKYLCLPLDSKSSCLGGDDTIGVFIMREMILAHVPGHYVFHYGEESGGIGSRKLATKSPAAFFTQFDYAIALDRAGTGDIITHQAGSRCCSDTFAASLAGQLGGEYAPSSHGAYTDTAEYTDAIGECTNVSIGYFNQHSPDEFVLLPHVWRLLDALIHLDQSALVLARKPGEVDPADSVYSWYASYGKYVNKAYQAQNDTTVIDGVLYDEDGYSLEDEEEVDENEDNLYLSPEYAELVREIRAEEERKLAR